MFFRSFFIVCLISKICFAQKRLNIEELINAKNLSFNEKITKIDISIADLKNNNGSVKKEIYSYITWLQKNKKFQKICSIATANIKDQKKKNLIDTTYIQNLYYYLGLSKYQLRQYDLSISFLQSGLQLVNDNTIAGDLYFNLGKCYHRKGDYYQSIKYYQLAQNLFLKYANLDQLFKSYVNITLPYDKLKTKQAYLKSRAYFLKADSLTPYTSIGKRYSYVVKMGLGNSYNTNETLNIPKASLYYKEALAITKRKKDSFNLSIINCSLGNLYNTTNPDLGLKYQTKSLGYLNKKRPLRLSIIYDNMAYCYAKKRQYNKSIAHYIKAINYLIGESNEFWADTLKIKLQKNLLNKKNLLIKLRDLANVYYKKYQNEKSPHILNKSLNTFLLADQLIDLMLLESQEMQSKLFWREQSAELYGKAIEACFLANDAKKAFYFMEKNKALLLTKDLKEQEIKQSLHLPDSIIKKERKLKRSIYNLKQLNTPNKDSINIAVLGVEYDLKKLQDSIQQKYTSYKAINLKTDILALSELQNNMAINDAVVCYNINKYDDYSLITPENKYTPVIPNCKYGVKTFHPAYGLLITKDHVAFFKLNNAEQLKSKVQELIKLMSIAFEPIKDDSSVFNQKAFELYNALLPSKELQKIIKNKKLRIIPDNYLNYLPFEALITSNSPKPSYWIQENEISYAYSNTFLNNIKSEKSNTANSFVGFSPITYNSSALSPLYNCLDEINTVSNYFPGSTYTHKKATKKAFLKTLAKYDIIHLATHADAQDDISPWIAFSDEKITLNELELTTNNAKMVVLSGCNTLLGKQETGEGIMSLARGFFQSGAKSVVSSLWNVDDESTAAIMNTFYKNLKEGKSKSASLRLAKLKYINSHNLPENSPHYWAPFVVLGETSPLVNSAFNEWWLISFLFPLIVLSCFFIRKWLSKKNRRTKNTV